MSDQQGTPQVPGEQPQQGPGEPGAQQPQQMPPVTPPPVTQQAAPEPAAPPQPAYGQPAPPPPAYGQPAPPQPAYGQPAYGQPAYGQPGAPMGAVQPMNVLAIVGFILAFFTTVIGMVLSIVALVQINRTGQRGKGLAIAGIIIGAVEFVLWIVIIIVIIAAAASISYQNGS